MLLKSIYTLLCTLWYSSVVVRHRFKGISNGTSTGQSNYLFPIVLGICTTVWQIPYRTHTEMKIQRYIFMYHIMQGDHTYGKDHIVRAVKTVPVRRGGNADMDTYRMVCMYTIHIQKDCISTEKTILVYTRTLKIVVV